MFSIKDEKKTIKTGLYIIMAVFLCLCLYVALNYGNTQLLGSLQKFDNDDVKYIRSAWTLMDKGILAYENTQKSTVYIMPGLSMILYGFMRIFGRTDGLLAFRVFQALLQTLNIYILFILCRRIFDSKTALIACLLDSLYIVNVFVSNLILMECIFRTLFLLVVYISLYALETKRVRLYLWGGMLWSLACLFRPTIVLYPVVILIQWIKSKYKIGEMIKLTLIVLSIFIFIMSPWWIRNDRAFGQFIPFTLSSGNPFLQGTYINYDQSKDYMPYKVTTDSKENDRIELETGLQRLKIYGKKQPLLYLYWYTIGKSIYFWDTPFCWRMVLGVPYAVVLIYHYLLLGLGLIGFLISMKRKQDIWFLVSVICYFNLIYLPYYTFARYAYPVMSIVAIFASNGLITLLKVRKKEIIYNG